MSFEINWLNLISVFYLLSSISIISAFHYHRERSFDCPQISKIRPVSISLSDLKGHWYEIKRTDFVREKTATCVEFDFSKFKTPKGELYAYKTYHLYSAKTFVLATSKCVRN